MLSGEARRELLAQIRERIVRWGFETYVAAPIIEATDRFFPDPYTSDIRGVRTVARRLLKHVGLEHLEVDAFGLERADENPLAQTYVVLGELTEQLFVLDVYGIGTAEDVPLVLTHEVARAYDRLRLGPMRGDHPYRAPAFQDDEELEPDPAEEAEISSTAMYLGLGLLVALGAHRYKASGEIAGTSVITRWVHQCLGGLAPDEACFLLAAHAVARDEDDETTQRWCKALGLNERKFFSCFLRELRADRGGLLESLGLPAEDTWPERADADHEPLVDDDWQPQVAEASEEEAPPKRPVFRQSRDHGMNMLMGSTFLSGLGFSAVAFNAPEYALVAAIAAPASVVGSYVWGRRLARTDMCSSCEALISAEANECPSCDGEVRGRLEKGETHFAALERLPDVTTFGFIAEPQGDAAARYVDLGVKCPSCGWIPDGAKHWQCDSCSGELFNTFAHGGECPHCDEVFEETLCPRCDRMAAYDWWWPADES